MLLRYIVSNFKSIGHPVEFSMFPTEENVDESYLKTIKNKGRRMEDTAPGLFFLVPTHPGRLLLLSQSVLHAILLWMDRKAEREQVSTSSEVILMI